MDTEILQRIRERANRPETRTDQARLAPTTVSPPAIEADVAAAESALTFMLPSALRDLYLEIGNGGFGPGYGLIGLPPDGFADDLDRTLVRLYDSYAQTDPDYPEWQWPEKLLPICHWGCAIYSCIDCDVPEAPVYRFDPNLWQPERPISDAIRPERPSFMAWIGAWSEGQGLWQREQQDV